MRTGTKVGLAFAGLTIALTGCAKPTERAIIEALAGSHLSEGTFVLPKKSGIPVFAASQEGEGGDLTRTYRGLPPKEGEMTTEYPCVIERTGGSNGKKDVVAIFCRYTVDGTGTLVQQPNGGRVFQVFEDDLEEVNPIDEVVNYYLAQGKTVDQIQKIEP